MNFVLRTFPINLSKNIPLDTEIEITFLFDMNKDSFSASNVILFDMEAQKSVPIEFEYKSRLLRIAPKSRLRPLIHYQVEMVGMSKTGIQDIMGRSLLQSYKFEFSSGEETRIGKATMLSPIDTSEIRSDIPFRWQSVDKADHYQLEVSRSNTFDVLEWPKQDVIITTTEIMPDITYEKGVTYYARVRGLTPQGVAGAFSAAIRFYYNGPTERKVSEEDLETTYKEVIRASEGDVLINLSYPYTPGVGDLTVTYNGQVINPCSSPIAIDGQYREIAAQMILLVDAAHEGDMIEIEIGKPPVPLPPPPIENPNQSELDILKDYFDDLKDPTPKYLEIKSMKPKNGTVMVSSVAPIIITFDQDVDVNTISPETIYVVEEKN